MKLLPFLIQGEAPTEKRHRTNWNSGTVIGDIDSGAYGRQATIAAYRICSCPFRIPLGIVWTPFEKYAARDRPVFLDDEGRTPRRRSFRSDMRKGY